MRNNHQVCALPTNPFWEELALLCVCCMGGLCKQSYALLSTVCVTTHCCPGKLCCQHGDPAKFLGGFPCISSCFQHTLMAPCQENLNSGCSGLPKICLLKAGIAKRLFCSRCCTVLQNPILRLPTCMWARPARSAHTAHVCVDTPTWPIETLDTRQIYSCLIVKIIPCAVNPFAKSD